jgi:hypothetical protein
MYLGVGAGFNSSQTPGAKLAWTDTDTTGMSVASEHAYSSFFRVYSGWNIYTIDLTQIGIQPGVGTLNWGGNITGLILYTGLSTTNAAITNAKIDWVRLTPKPSRTVTWSGSWQTSAQAEIQFSADGSTFDPLKVYTHNNPCGCAVIEPDNIPAGSNGSNGSYPVPASFPPGPQYVKVKISDGTGSTTSSPGAGPWQFNALPDFTYVAPSYTSGDDFATNVVGNPWDMSDPGDISSWGNLTGAPTFSNGILSGTSNAAPPNCGLPWGDPQLLLNMNGAIIDTNYYRYFTVKIKVDRQFDFGNGWVSRVYWAINNFGTFGGSNDMPLYQNPDWNTAPYWNTFNVDMWGNVQDEAVPGNLPWRNGSPNILRFDPHEIPPSTQFEVDYVKLTANDNAPRNGAFKIKYLLNTSYNATFYYDTDRNPSNGRTLASGTSSSAIPAAAPSSVFKVFLPLVQGGSTSPTDPPGTRIFNWNLDGVPGNTYYYISADVNDGYNTTTWYSDTPMFIQP